jgi:regulator of nonsense transcripts 3
MRFHEGIMRSNPLQSANDGEAAPKATRAKPQNEGEKLVVRRLPPGLTKDEFASILGPDWQVSKGKVDWLSFIAGKLSTEYV